MSDPFAEALARMFADKPYRLETRDVYEWRVFVRGLERAHEFGSFADLDASGLVDKLPEVRDLAILFAKIADPRSMLTLLPWVEWSEQLSDGWVVVLGSEHVER